MAHHAARSAFGSRESLETGLMVVERDRYRLRMQGPLKRPV